ncbi:MAG: TIGR00730 family Rossman fold protein [Luteibacter sp.]
MRTITSVAVFCGSNQGGASGYADAAKWLGHILGSERITLVYGGTVNGLMGILADAALAAGGEVHGVVTLSLHQRGHTHPRLSRKDITPNLRLRKERMAELADAFIALPGGIGTLEELMDTWGRNQLAEIDKPMGLLNTLGFFDGFLRFLDHMVGERFLPDAHRQALSVDADARGLVDALRRYQRTDVPKWL